MWAKTYLKGKTVSQGLSSVSRAKQCALSSVSRAKQCGLSNVG